MPKGFLYQRPYIAALCRGGIENRELALELVCGADFWCNRHCKTSPVEREEFWGQVFQKIYQKPNPQISVQTAGRPLLTTTALALDSWADDGPLLLDPKPPTPRSAARGFSIECLENPSRPWAWEGQDFERGGTPPPPPQGAKNNVKYRPKASYAELAFGPDLARLS